MKTCKSLAAASCPIGQVSDLSFSLCSFLCFHRFFSGQDMLLHRKQWGGNTKGLSIYSTGFRSGLYSLWQASDRCLVKWDANVRVFLHSFTIEYVYIVCIHVGGTHMKVRRQLSGVGSLHFYVGSWDLTQAIRLTQQVPLLLHKSVFVILTQTWTYLRRGNYNWETVLIRLASRQACGAFSWLMVNVARSGSSWAVPPWGGWFWAV